MCSITVEEKSLVEIVKETCGKFPACKNFLEEGLTTQQLNATIGCMSLLMKHDTVSYHYGSHCLVYCCSLCLTRVDGKPSLVNGGCPFFLQFRRTEGSFWNLDIDSEKRIFQRQNCISRSCTDCKLPSICQTASCFEAVISGYQKASGQSSSQVIKEKDAMKWLGFCDEQGVPMSPSCRRTLRRALSDVMEKSPNGLLESGRKLEDYICCLNRGGGTNETRQYGTLLYSTGELVIPGTEETGKYKFCPLNPRRRPAFCSSVLGREKFWDGLADVDPRDEEKSVLFTIQAVRVSVEAFQYSFPVIFLDSCFLKIPGPPTQLLSASFKTTENHLLPMCFGTAPSESNWSWNFFLCNLRQVLVEFCPEIHDFRNILFMSDRNKGLLNAVPAQFPESLHHFCTVHLLSNLNGKVNEYCYWSAVQSVNAEMLDHYCSRIGVDMTEMKRLCKHWVLYGVLEEGRKRYKIHTNNGAESMNNAFDSYRSLCPLNALHGLFLYTGRKFQEYRSLPSEPGCAFTRYGMDSYQSK